MRRWSRRVPVRELYPASTVEPDTTVAEFDARHPECADDAHPAPDMSRADGPP